MTESEFKKYRFFLFQLHLNHGGHAPDCQIQKTTDWCYVLYPLPSMPLLYSCRQNGSSFHLFKTLLLLNPWKIFTMYKISLHKHCVVRLQNVAPFFSYGSIFFPCNQKNFFKILILFSSCKNIAVEMMINITGL